MNLSSSFLILLFTIFGFNQATNDVSFENKVLSTNVSEEATSCNSCFDDVRCFEGKQCMRAAFADWESGRCDFSEIFGCSTSNVICSRPTSSSTFTYSYYVDSDGDVDVQSEILTPFRSDLFQYISAYQSADTYPCSIEITLTSFGCTERSLNSCTIDVRLINAHTCD